MPSYIKFLTAFLITFATQFLFASALWVANNFIFTEAAIPYMIITLTAFRTLKLYYTYGGRYFSKTFLAFGGSLAWLTACSAISLMTENAIHSSDYIAGTLFLVGLTVIFYADTKMERDTVSTTHQ